jgi:hypothetical protein
MARHRCRPATAAPGRVGLAPQPAPASAGRDLASQPLQLGTLVGGEARVSDMADTVLGCMSRLPGVPGGLADLLRSGIT